MVLRRNENKPYFPPRILGLEKTDSYVKYDLLQLMALFFHRSQLLVSSARRAVGTTPQCPGARGWTVSCPGWAWPSRLVQAWSSWCPHCPSLPSTQCYGLWDHEEDQFSKEQSRSSGKGPGAEAGPETLLGPRTEAGTEQEEPGVAGATAKDHIQVEARAVPEDGVPEPQVDRRPQDTRRISLRFRRRKERPGPSGATAMGERALTTGPWFPQECWLSAVSGEVEEAGMAIPSLGGARPSRHQLDDRTALGCGSGSPGGQSGALLSAGPAAQQCPGWPQLPLTGHGEAPVLSASL